MRHKRLITLLTCLLLGLGCTDLAQASDYHQLCNDHQLQSQELIAWLEIPGASICTPVMRRPGDDSYYANHSPEGKEKEGGVVYVQSKYNAADFSDPVTLVYGSSASKDAAFGRLQELFSGSFESCRTVYLHTPEKTQEYVVFAALPYSSIHILHYYDFASERRYNGFFDSVFSTRALGMHLDEDKRPVPGKDQVIILSTGLRGDSLQRYLVMAKRVTP